MSFRYPDAAEPVLNGINLYVPAGTSLALVGRSGAGKSTLVDLILGLQRPTAGLILADSIDVGTQLKAWQAGLAMVPQDVYLLEGSIRDNVYFTPGVDDPDDARLRSAIEQASLADLIDNVPDGLETQVGDRGTRLSGGQRQRVGLARALFRSPHLLVLDEATSALDNETEHEVSQTITRLHGQITTILVAHRLSTVKHCDQVAFLEDGRVSALGTFDELRRQSPAFARLVALGSLDPLEGAAWSSRSDANSFGGPFLSRLRQVNRGRPTSGRTRRGGPCLRLQRRHSQQAAYQGLSRASLVDLAMRPGIKPGSGCSRSGP